MYENNTIRFSRPPINLKFAALGQHGTFAPPLNTSKCNHLLPISKRWVPWVRSTLCFNNIYKSKRGN